MYSLTLDIGTTTLKAVLFDESFSVVAKSSRNLSKQFPKKDWVEQEPREFVKKSLEVLREVFKVTSVSPTDCRMGITNQRETTIIWNKTTGETVYPAIGWEDKRTQAWCDAQSDKAKKFVFEKSGLPLIEYFSATKIAWIINSLKNSTVETVYDVDLAFGTVDSWLMWNLLKDHPHITDSTNASRTLLFDIYAQDWSQELVDLFGLPMSILPEVKKSAFWFGVLDKSVVGTEIPVTAVCGDQQSSLFAAMCAQGPGEHYTKVTCGTGTFVMQTCARNAKIPPGWFKTLTPSADTKSLTYALETKIEKGAREVDEILKTGKGLDGFLYSLAQSIANKIAQLPIKPEMILIDGGVSRDGIVSTRLEEITKIPVKSLSTFDGTALGVAQLCSK